MWCAEIANDTSGFDRQTLCESTADLHGTVPLAVLAGEELVVCLQSVALVTEVLDDRFMGEVVTGRRVAAVAPILRFSGWQTSWEEVGVEVLKRILLAEGARAPRPIQMVPLLTIAFNAARRRVGPGSRAGTDDADGSICGVARVAAVHQQGPRGEGAPVSFGLVKQLSVLHTRRLSTT